jgi:limonene-1,2-epoxide hydrolase
MKEWGRRDVLLTAGFGLVVTAACGESAPATRQPLTHIEQANVKLIRDFLASWDNPALDIDKIIADYFAPTATVRWTDDSSPAVGVAAAAAAAKAGMPPGAVAHVDVYDIWAHGPVVATSRLDTVKVPGRPDTLFKTAGVAVVQNGKIVEYCDYVIK